MLQMAIDTFSPLSNNIDHTFKLDVHGTRLATGAILVDPRLRGIE